MKLALKQKAIMMRLEGWSYRDITQALPVAKSTLSHWLRNVPYNPNEVVSRRISAGQARSAHTRQQRRISNIKRIHAAAAKDIGTLSIRDLKMLGIALYIGEGSKAYEQVSITNSDARVLLLLMRWFREVCEVPNNHFAAAIHVYPDTDTNAAIDYWSDLTKIPKNQFCKTQIDRRTNKSSNKRRMLRNGTLRIDVRSRSNPAYGTELHRKIMGWINAVLK